MNGNTLIDSIYKLYQSSKAKKHLGARIYRGTIPSISAQTEDLFAFYMDAIISDKNVCILVDTYITLSNNLSVSARTGKKLQFKPDICIIDAKGTVRILCELKMDIGYKRDFINYAYERNRLLDFFKGNAAHYISDGTRRTIQFPESLEWYYIIFSERNSGFATMKQIEQGFQQQPALGKFLVLSKGDHLNSTSPNYTVNNSAFNALEKILKSI